MPTIDHTQKDGTRTILEYSKPWSAPKDETPWDPDAPMRINDLAIEKPPRTVRIIRPVNGR